MSDILELSSFAPFAKWITLASSKDKIKTPIYNSFGIVSKKDETVQWMASTDGRRLHLQKLEFTAESGVYNIIISTNKLVMGQHVDDIFPNVFQCIPKFEVFTSSFLLGNETMIDQYLFDIFASVQKKSYVLVNSVYFREALKGFQASKVYMYSEDDVTPIVLGDSLKLVDAVKLAVIMPLRRI